MTAAYLLQRQHDVTIFESRPYLGGNADTRNAKLADGTEVPVDVGFMAFGDQTYPTFVRLLSELGVASRPADVAIDIRCSSCGFTQIARSPSSDLPRPSGVEEATWDRFNAERERFALDVKEVHAAGTAAPSQSVQDFLNDKKYSEYFFQHYVYPRAAPWFLYDANSVRVMSIGFLVSALHKYGVLDSVLVAGWRVVDGGSRTYLNRIAEKLHAVHTGTPIRQIQRTPHGVLVRDATGHLRTYDKAVIAVPAPTALELLGDDATADEREILGAFQYTRMTVTLHTDSSVLPPAKHNGICMTVSCAENDGSFRDCDIDASILQTLHTPHPVIVSYNSTHHIAPETVWHQATYEHPVFTVNAFDAQRQLQDLSTSQLAFAGSYFGSSLHEDGCLSGAQAAASLGVEWS
jgi:uncharacterized protein